MKFRESVRSGPRCAPGVVKRPRPKGSFCMNFLQNLQEKGKNSVARERKDSFLEDSPSKELDGEIFSNPIVVIEDGNDDKTTVIFTTNASAKECMQYYSNSDRFGNLNHKLPLK